MRGGTLAAGSVSKLRHFIQFLDLFTGQLAIENCEFINPTIPHIEILFFRRITTEVEFCANS